MYTSQAADAITSNPVKRVGVDSKLIADLLSGERVHGDTKVSGFKVDSAHEIHFSIRFIVKVLVVAM